MCIRNPKVCWELFNDSRPVIEVSVYVGTHSDLGQIPSRFVQMVQLEQNYQALCPARDKIDVDPYQISDPDRRENAKPVFNSGQRRAQKLVSTYHLVLGYIMLSRPAEGTGLYGQVSAVKIELGGCYRLLSVDDRVR